MVIPKRWTFLNDAVADFPADNYNSASFQFKTKMAGRTGNEGTKSVKIMKALKYLINYRNLLKCY